VSRKRKSIVLLSEERKEKHPHLFKKIPEPCTKGKACCSREEQDLKKSSREMRWAILKGISGGGNLSARKKGNAMPHQKKSARVIPDFGGKTR